MREQRQLQALKSIEDANYVGTLKACVGFGKFFMFFRTIRSMSNKGLLKPGSSILFMAETEARVTDLNREKVFYNEVTGFDLEQFNIEFACYQSRILEKRTGFDFICMDEIHSVSVQFGKQFENYNGYRLGLSATIAAAKPFGIIEGESTAFSKLDWVESYCPVVFEYSMAQGISEGIISQFETYLFETELDNTQKKFQLWKKFPDPVTAKTFYEKKLEYANRIMFTNKFVALNIRRNQLPQFLWNYEGRVPQVKKVVNKLLSNGERILVWGRNLDYLESIIPGHVVRAKDTLVEQFNAGTINVLGTATKLKQGATLKGLSALVLTSPPGSSEEFEQLIGRVVRNDKGGKPAKLIIFYEKGTYTEKWLNECRKKKDKNKKTIDFVEINVKTTVKY